MREGVSVDVFLAKIIEQSVSAAGNGRELDGFKIADELGLKSQRSWKRDDLYER